MVISTSLFVMNMTKLLESGWSRGVQLFHELCCSTIRALNEGPEGGS